MSDPWEDGANVDNSRSATGSNNQIKDRKELLERMLLLEKWEKAEEREEKLAKIREAEAQRSTEIDSASSPTSVPDAASNAMINSLMATNDVIARLGDHGCQNITSHLDLASCSSYPISSGGFGDVYLGKLHDGSKVAIKTMRIHIKSDEGQKPLKNAARELHTWSKCQHKNVLKLLGLVEFRNQIGMVSRWMKNGSLPSYLEQHPEVDRCQISSEICEGLSYLHSEKIVHGDLKGLNVLISGNGMPVLTDFGNAVLQHSTLQFTATTAKYSVSARWTAPELIEGSSTYSYEGDVYALGMTILETITGNLPYIGKTDQGVYYAVMVKKEPPKRPEEHIPSNSQHGNALWSLLSSCWTHEVESRPSADRVLETMKGIRQDGLKFARSEPTEE